MTNFKKLFAIDLDGTLLSKIKKISEKDVASLKNYLSKGGEIAIITGKSISSGLKHIRSLEQRMNMKMKYASFLTGAIIYDLINDKVIFESKISDVNIMKLCDLCSNNKCNFVAVDEIDKKEHYVMNKSVLFNVLMRLFYIKKNPYSKIKKNIKFESFKFNASKKVFSINRLKKLKEKIDEFNKFHVSATNRWFYEITMNDANKEKALSKISSLLKIDMNDTAAIGDSSNDIPMLSVANLSFGIDNGSDDFRNSSRVLIKRSKRNPVSYAIDYMLK